MKILLMRFSSFGDVLQTLSVVGRLVEGFPASEIHWVTREEFAPLISSHPSVRKVWTLRKGAGLSDLIKLGQLLRAEGFTHVYDAHNNLRSRILSWQLNGLFAWRVWSGRHRFLRRSIYRWRRFLLFRFRINRFPKPFSGQFALLEPLAKWGLDSTLPAPPQLFLQQKIMADKVRQFWPQSWIEFVALAPSAAFELKRWPIEYWADLIQQMANTRFVILGGPEDGFLAELVKAAPDRVVNLAGRLNLLESSYVVAQAKALIANDTGLMHVAEQIGKPCLALMGPAPFGYPSRAATQIFELELSCRPCSKHGQGPCVNKEFHKCLRGISPSWVAQELKRTLNA